MSEPSHPRPAVPASSHHDAARAAAARFGTVVASVGTAINDDDHLLEVLHRLTAAACENIESADYASITIDFGGHTFTSCATDERTTSAIDDEQYTLGDGPCLTAARERSTVVADCVAGDDRWPRFGPTAVAAGVSSALSAPIDAGGRTVGAINLFSATRGGFDSIDETLLTALTAAFGHALSDYAAKRSAQDTVDGLRAAMEHRAPIEQAKGIVMALYRIGPDAAFARLSQRSQDENRKLRDIAVEFVAAVASADAAI